MVGKISSVIQEVFFGLVGVRNALYDRGVFRRVSIDLPIISVGNISWGGTGKTEFVKLIAKYFIDQGMKTLIVSRGYRCKLRGGLKEIRGEDDLACDEPLMLKESLPEAYVFIGVKREVVIGEALRHYPIDICILDDGFQYRRLERNLDIVLVVEGQRWFREPIKSLKRADLVVINKIKDVKAAEELRKQIALVTDAPIVGSKYKIYVPEKRNFLLVCAVAEPREVCSALEQEGVRVEDITFFPDHYIYGEKDVVKILKRARQKKLTVLTTAKDWVKLGKFGNMFKESGVDVFIIRVEVSFLWDEDIFWRSIKELERLIDENCF